MYRPDSITDYCQFVPARFGESGQVKLAHKLNLVAWCGELRFDNKTIFCFEELLLLFYYY